MSIFNEATLLHGHRFLLRAGLAIGNVFAWIFIFEYFALLSGSTVRAIAATLLMYALSQGITIFLTPLAAAHLRRGTRSALMWSVVLGASAFVILGATLGGFFDTSPVAWGIVLFSILLGAYRALYFTPYALNNAAVSSRSNNLAYELFLALIPAFVGATLVMQAYAPLKLLFGAAALVGLSMLPVYLFANIHERFSYSYGETFRELWARGNNSLVLVSFFEGVQSAALFLVWPLAVFLIVGWSYVMLGIVFSVTLLLVLLFRKLFRSLVTSTPVEHSIPVQVSLVVSGWVLRLFAGNPLGVVLADSYAYSARPLRGTTIDPFILEQAADNGTYLDERTVLKEIALAGGRIVFVGILGVLIFVTEPPVVFIGAILLAALAAGAAIIIARKAEIPAY